MWLCMAAATTASLRVGQWHFNSSPPVFHCHDPSPPPLLTPLFYTHTSNNWPSCLIWESPLLHQCPLLPPFHLVLWKQNRNMYWVTPRLFGWGTLQEWFWQLQPCQTACHSKCILCEQPICCPKCSTPLSQFSICSLVQSCLPACGLQQEVCMHPRPFPHHQKLGVFLPDCITTLTLSLPHLPRSLSEND